MNEQGLITNFNIYEDQYLKFERKKKVNRIKLRFPLYKVKKGRKKYIPKWVIEISYI